MQRYDIINRLIKKYDYKNYLEIGVADGYSFDRVRCANKIGIDPEPASPASYHITSDEFFTKNVMKFDIILIDGLHENEQVYRDINNSLLILSKDGTIVCHDMNPIQEIHQVPPDKRETKLWNGNCWMAWARLRMERKDLEMAVLDTDWGVGLIRKGKQRLVTEVKLNYKYLVANRKKILNLQKPEYLDLWLK